MENENLDVDVACEDDQYDMFISAHESQLLSLGIPECKWRVLYYKLSGSIFDAGNDFVYSQEVLENGSSNMAEGCCQYHWRVYTKCAMDPEDADHIYLIDHGWTYTCNNVKQILMENASLLQRMCCIMNVSNSNRPLNDVVDDVLREMWKYNNSYSVHKSSQASSVTRCWFIMDEFGSRINRAEEPSFEIVPFYYVTENITFSLLFPKVSVAEEEEVTCCYPKFSSTLSEDMQKAVKYPWNQCDLSDLDFYQLEPGIGYFTSGRHVEVLPESIKEMPPVPISDVIQVFTDYPEVGEHLTLPRFQIVREKSKAHVFWLAERVYDYKELSENSLQPFYINQFPSEQVLLSKDLLAIVSRRMIKEQSFNPDSLESYPKWLPTTYSLLIELPQFISYFQNREKRHLDNIWICKPFNLARGLEIHITDNLISIIRLSETRPMVACKYITDSVLFPKEGVGLVKMDLRFIVLLKHVNPLELYVYERFWLRFANKPFALDEFDDYEKHFTVMNYVDFPLKQMYCHDFIKIFEDYYPEYKWCDIEKSIYDMIKEIFTAASLKDPPAGIGDFVGSRAMYGLDVMLEWDRNHSEPRINPVILEVNWMPDCKRACQYYPEFYNDVFSVLFLNDSKERHVVQL